MKGCGLNKVCGLLVFVGGLNWGLVGAGMIFGSMHDMSWNLVHMLLGKWATVEAVVYVLVGIAALCKLWHCKCAKCAAACAACSAGAQA